MKCYPYHKDDKVNLTDYLGEPIRADSGIAELVQKCTDHRMVVRGSCQGYDDIYKDPTHYAAGQYRAYLNLKRDEITMAFVQGLIMDSHFFMADKVLWDIVFDRIPHGDNKDENRITLVFPAQDIKPLIDYFEMKNSLASISNGEISIP